MTTSTQERAAACAYIATLSEPEKEYRRMAAKISYYNKFLLARVPSRETPDEAKHRANYMTPDAIIQEIEKCRARAAALKPECAHAKEQRKIARKLARAEARVEELRQGIDRADVKKDEMH